MLSQICCLRKFDLDIHADFVEGLVVRGKTTEEGNGNRSKNRSKSKNDHAGNTCNYCGKLGHIVANCWQLQKKKDKVNLVKQTGDPRSEPNDPDSCPTQKWTPNPN